MTLTAVVAGPLKRAERAQLWRALTLDRKTFLDPSTGLGIG